MLFEVLCHYKTLEKYVWQSILGMFKLSVIAYSVVPSKNVFVRGHRGLTDFFAQEKSGKLPSPDLKRNYSQVFCGSFLPPPPPYIGFREERSLHQQKREKRGL